MKTNKFLSVFLAFAMIFSLAGVGYVNASEQGALDFTLDFEDDNYPGYSGDGWTWDSGNRILTIDGLVINSQETALKLPDNSTIVVSENSINSIISSGNNGIQCYGNMTVTGNGILNIDSYDTGMRVTGDLSVGQMESLVIESGYFGIRVGPGKETYSGAPGDLNIMETGNIDIMSDSSGIRVSGDIFIYEVERIDIEAGNKGIQAGMSYSDTVPAIRENLTEEIPYSEGNIVIVSTNEIFINSEESGLHALGSLLVDDVDTLDIFVYRSGNAGIRVGGGSRNYNENDGNAVIINSGSVLVESIHTSVRVMGDFHAENIDLLNLTSNHTAIRTGRGDPEIISESHGNASIINCNEVVLDAGHTGIRSVGNTTVENTGIFRINAGHMGIRAGSSYSSWSIQNEWSQSESAGFVHIINTNKVEIDASYTGIRSHSDIWFYNVREGTIDATSQENYDIRMQRRYDSYGLYASAGNVTIQRSNMDIKAHTVGAVTGNVCGNHPSETMDLMYGGDIIINQSYVTSSVGEDGKAALAAGNASSDSSKRDIIIVMARIIEPENAYIVDVDIEGMMLDKSVTGDPEVSVITDSSQALNMLVISPYYNISYDSNTGTGTMSDPDSPYLSGSVAVVMENTFAKDYHNFSGFNTSADGSGVDYNPGDEILVTDDIVLYAQYDIFAYTVTFVDWDDTVIGTTQTEHGSNADSPEYPVREGYVFKGWDQSLENIIEDTTVKALYSVDEEYVENLVKRAEDTKSQSDLDNARAWTELLDPGEVKDSFTQRLNALQEIIDDEMETVEPGDPFSSFAILLIMMSFGISGIVFGLKKKIS